MFQLDETVDLDERRKIRVALRDVLTRPSTSPLPPGLARRRSSALTLSAQSGERRPSVLLQKKRDFISENKKNASRRDSRVGLIALESGRRDSIVGSAATGRRGSVACVGSGKRDSVAGLESGKKSLLAGVASGRRDSVACVGSGKKDLLAGVASGRRDSVAGTPKKLLGAAGGRRESVAKNIGGRRESVAGKKDSGFGGGGRRDSLAVKKDSGLGGGRRDSVAGTTAGRRKSHVGGLGKENIGAVAGGQKLHGATGSPKDSPARGITAHQHANTGISREGPSGMRAGRRESGAGMVGTQAGRRASGAGLVGGRRGSKVSPLVDSQHDKGKAVSLLQKMVCLLILLSLLLVLAQVTASIVLSTLGLFHLLPVS